MDQIAPYFFIFLLAAFSKTLASSTFDGARLGMRHVDFGSNFTKDELLARSAFRSSRLSLQYSSGEYMIELSIGTPDPQPISGVADTGSDIIWTQCEQPTSLYDPKKSQTYSALPCNSNACLNAPNPEPNQCCSYRITYGSSTAQGTLLSDTFLLGDTNPVSVPEMVFGCTTSSTATVSGAAAPTGIIGLSRSEYSLIEQLGVDKFSYCLQPDKDTIHPMFLGSAAILDGSLVQSTPFVAPQETTNYYVNLMGISLGSEQLSIPQSLFQYNPSDGSGGVIIDSGTSITRLVPQALKIVSQAVQDKVNLPTADGSKYNLQLCFSLPSGSEAPSMPDLTFHFDGADLELNVDKYMTQTDDGLFCLLILEPPFTQSIIGTIQTQNLHVLYDLSNNMLSFAPAECDKL
ncbi:Aspartic proteinase nepenthesin-1 [Rhynchospora pubera]|uniref:Aspartic proteinase nepenthesin-1 n=1 Tax=Rhynchospora pubera TaxID=906938 RepID=A0AAV8FXK6_9POAL|nr:Aspartic proteinase nepenthesin-1 [Rhynchospora pubera]